MAFQAGTAFVPVIPSFRGFQQQVARAAGVAGREAGQQITRSMGDEAERGSSGVAGRLRSGLSRLNTAMTGVGIAAGAALSAALVKGLDSSRAQAKLAASLGATGKDAERFGRIAGELYSRAYGESMDDVRAAIGAVVTSIDGMRDANEDAVKQMTARAMTLASTFDLDVARAVQVVGQMVRTGLVKDAQQGIDMLFVALQKVPVAVREDILDALDEYGPFMAQIGIKGQQAFNLLVAGAEKGMYGIDKTGDALKEFTIRATDMSAATQDAYQSLGLNAQQMTNDLLAGGQRGQQAFDQIIRGLQGIKDPAAQSQAALALFGTPLEDLSTGDIPKFLASLDTTRDRLGSTAGAADRAGQAMEETAGAKVEAFKRSMEQNVSQVVADDVIPKLEDLGRVASSVGVTPSGVVSAGIALAGLALAFKTAGLAATIATAQVGRFSIASTVTGTAGAISGAIAGFRNVNLAMAANATMSQRLGAALRSQIMLWRQQAAATGVSTARIILNAAAQQVAAAATRVWAAAQAVFNAIMSANPIALIVIAIAGLVAAVVVAYQRFDWFRNLVNAAWSGIQTAISAAWGFIQPIFQAIANVLTTVVGTALRWYWAYVKFVFTTMWTIIQTAWNLIQPIFTAIATVVRAVLGVAFIALQNVIKVVWIAIQIYIKVAWLAIKGYFTLLKLYITGVLAPVFRWLYNSLIKPVWSGIRAAISAAWSGIKATWNAIKGFLSAVLGPAFKAFRSTSSTVWNAVKATISSVWNNGIKPTFNALKSAVGAVKTAFKTAVDGIKVVWDKLKSIAKTPVNFVIGLYNDGIVSLVNKIASFAGIKTRLDKIPKFARGGVMPGYAPGRDTLLAAVSPGESIFRPEFTRAVGSSWVQTANALARRRGPSAVRQWLAHGGDRLGGEGLAFARGGVAPGPGWAGAFSLGGIVGGFMKGLKDFAFGNVEKAFRGVLNKITGGIPGAGIFRDVIAAIPKKLIDTLVQWFKDKVGMGGGPGYQRAMAFAKAQAGKPYVWGGVGPGGYDCSGFMSALTNVIQGKNPYTRRFTTFSFTGASSGPAGFVRNKRSAFEVGVTNSGVGHMAGTLLGKNVESSGSAGVRVGGGARGAADGLFTMRYGLYDDGGLLHRGLTLAHHATRKPDRVLSDAQWSSIHTAATSDNGPQTVNNFYPRTLDMTVRDLEVLQRKQDARARVGRPR